MKRVLIVDDEADVLWMLQKNLNRGMPDIEVLVAASGEEALIVIESQPIDLVITDINMPGINGLDLLVEINNKYPHTGVIVITAYPSNTYQSQALLSGSLKFIEKPFDIRYLRKIVEEFFNHKKSGFQGTISGIDLIDIVQFNGLSRATAALKVTTDKSAGMIFFKDGQVVHAICDQLSGEDAFFTILGFHGGNLKNIKGVETPLVTISKSLELLLLEAASTDDEFLDAEEEPFLTYDELEKEPLPAFLSRSDKVEEPRSLLDEESPAFLSDDARGEDMSLEELLSDTMPSQVSDAASSQDAAVGRTAAIPGLDVDDDERGRAYFAKTSSILSAELRDQRAAALSDKIPVSPALADVENVDVDVSFLDDIPTFLADAGEEWPATMKAPAEPPAELPAELPVKPSTVSPAVVAAGEATGNSLAHAVSDIPGLDVGDEQFDELPSDGALDDFPAFLSEAEVAELPAKSPTKPPAKPPVEVPVALPAKKPVASPAALSVEAPVKSEATAPVKKSPTVPPAPAATPKPAVKAEARPASAFTENPLARQIADKGVTKAGKTVIKPAKELSPLDGILAEFTAIDGVRLACLTGRDGFLIANQPEGDSAKAEALSAIASSGLVAAESMGEELSRSGLQAGLFEYRDGMIILSPVGENSFLMLVAEERANLGWLRLVMRKNTSRIAKLDAQ